jgi:RNA polymerase sigma factor (sigma-70 family)
MPHSAPPRPGKRKYMAAMVLGTALSALGVGGSVAAGATVAPERAVADISRYCTTCWRNAHLHPDSWSDCTQEVFSRLLDRVAPEDWCRLLQAEGQERREFIRAIDAVKKRTQRSRKLSASEMDMVADVHEAHVRGLREDRQAVDEAAAELLSPRQQRILRLSFEGWSVADIAANLKTSPERVSDEKYKAIRKLREHLCG